MFTSFIIFILLCFIMVSSQSATFFPFFFYWGQSLAPNLFGAIFPNPLGDNL